MIGSEAPTARRDSSACDIDTIVAAVERDGFAVHPDFLSAELTAALARECRERLANGKFRDATVGRGASRTLSTTVRSDRIAWIDEEAPRDSVRAYLTAMEALRVALNGKTLLGLFDLESHFAVYLAGARYARHLDRFRDDDRRVISTVLYLNEGWTEQDGGALRIHLRDERASGTGHRDVLPAGGTLVMFLSDRYEHEVLPALRARLSVAGWFRRRR